jgi:hypothetical protein
MQKFAPNISAPDWGKSESNLLNEEVPMTPTYPTKKTSNKKLMNVVVGIFFVLALVFAAWVFLSGNSKKIISPFSKIGGIPSNKADDRLPVDLTGELVTPSDAAKWNDQRPLGVMVNNHVDARPQSGLIYADIIYEVVAEGGITRYLAFFQSYTPEKIGPVRSTRGYYLLIVKELGDAMLMHIGYSPQALVAIDTWPVRSLFRGGCESLAGCEWRDNPRNVAYEHTAYVSGVKLRELATTLGWEGKGPITLWKFKDDANLYSSKPSASSITIDFWAKGDYTGMFKYNPQNNSYLRFTGYDANDKPIPLMDQEKTTQQVEVKNLIVQFATESSIVEDVKGRLEYQLIGSGKALVFIDGKVVGATWTKSARDARTIFYDMDGNELQFNRGKFWISIVPDRNVDQVVYN